MNKLGITVADRGPILQWVKDHPGRIASEAAKATGVSLRNAQRALRFLEKGKEVHHRAAPTPGGRPLFLWYPGPTEEPEEEEDDPILLKRQRVRHVWKLDHPIGPRSIFDVNLSL